MWAYKLIVYACMYKVYKVYKTCVRPGLGNSPPVLVPDVEFRGPKQG